MNIYEIYGTFVKTKNYESELMSCGKIFCSNCQGFRNKLGTIQGENIIYSILKKYVSKKR